MNKYLTRYLVAAQHPDVSGFEVLDMLMTRDKLMQQHESLSLSEKAQLAAADQVVVANAPAFCQELSTITSLTYERQQRVPLPTQWWWYLDVITQLPEPATRQSELAVMPA
ncbi:MAG: hypothetical protein R3E79_06910 [Caldilineaceae bacterium]